MIEVAALICIFCTLTLLLLLGIACETDPHHVRLTNPWREYFVAKRRASQLLREILTENEYQQLKRYGYLDVPSPNFDQRMYRIPGAGGLVRVLEHGCAIMDLCLQPIEPLPVDDVIVMHKLMIESNEHEYLKLANRFQPTVHVLGGLSLHYRLP